MSNPTTHVDVTVSSASETTSSSTGFRVDFRVEANQPYHVTRLVHAHPSRDYDLYATVAPGNTNTNPQYVFGDYKSTWKLKLSFTNTDPSQDKNHTITDPRDPIIGDGR